MKKFVIASVSVIVIIVAAFFAAHTYRVDGVIDAVVHNNVADTVVFTAENGHRYAFEVVDVDDMPYEVGYDINVLMFDSFDEADPTDDEIWF